MTRFTRAGGFGLGLLAGVAAAPLAAQDPGNETRPLPTVSTPTVDSAAGPAAASVYDGDWVTVGVGGAFNASYDGSDDYVFTVLPLVQGRVGGVSVTPRAAGLALDFLPDRPGSKVNASLGVAGRLNRNRASRIEDPVVAAYGELGTAIEVGPTAGVSFPGVLNPYDSLTLSADVLFDVNGAHGGMTVNPAVTYFTPLSRGVAASLSLSARHVDDAYAAYYYSVPAAPAGVAAADRLPPFAADGGIDKLGANLLLGVDFDGDLTNGGLAAFALGGYSRMQGDGERTPFTRLRGAADQWFIGAGLGYTF